MGSGATTKYAIEYPISTDPNNVPGDMQTAMTQLDGLIASYSQGTLASRPAAAKAGRVYYATDNGLVYYDTGSAWIYFSPGSSVVTTKGDLLVASAANALARLGVGADAQVLTARSTASNGLGVQWETAAFTIPLPFPLAGPPVASSGDANPYAPIYIAVPSTQAVKLHAVYPTAALSSGTSYPTIKLRRFTSSAWGDIAGFGTTGSPLTANGTLITPGDITLADGDQLGLYVVAAGANVLSLSVTCLLVTARA